MYFRKAVTFETGYGQKNGEAEGEVITNGTSFYACLKPEHQLFMIRLVMIFVQDSFSINYKLFSSPVYVNDPGRIHENPDFGA